VHIAEKQSASWEIITEGLEKRGWIGGGIIVMFAKAILVNKSKT